MKAAYLDSSCLVAIAFNEPGAARLARQLETHERLFSSNLLEAELRAALAREGMPDDADHLLASVSWILPDRSLGRELRQVIEHGYVKGADLWHLACAVYLIGEKLDQLVFATRDRRQQEVAASVGFQLLS